LKRGVEGNVVEMELENWKIGNWGGRNLEKKSPTQRGFGENLWGKELKELGKIFGESPWVGKWNVLKERN